MTVVVKKKGSKWAVIDEKGTELFIGKTRVSCFRYAFNNGLEITSYQHG